MNPNRPDRPSCELCGLTFADQPELEEHMADHTNPVSVEHKVFDCTNCHRTFLTFNDLDLHNRRVHTPY